MTKQGFYFKDYCIQYQMNTDREKTNVKIVYNVLQPNGEPIEEGFMNPCTGYIYDYNGLNNCKAAINAHILQKQLKEGKVQSIEGLDSEGKLILNVVYIGGFEYWTIDNKGLFKRVHSSLYPNTPEIIADIKRLKKLKENRRKIDIEMNEISKKIDNNSLRTEARY